VPTWGHTTTRVISNVSLCVPLQVTCLQFCANRIVSGSDDNTLRVWNAITGKVSGEGPESVLAELGTRVGEKREGRE
jgi:WD40 repeat protein